MNGGFADLCLTTWLRHRKYWRSVRLQDPGDGRKVENQPPDPEVARGGDTAVSAIRPTGGIMGTETTASPTQRAPELLGQTVVVIGGSGGIGFETARRARTEGAKVILTGRNPERLQQAANEIGAQSTAAFDAAEPAALERFFRDLPTPIDHVMVTAGRPHYGRLIDMDLAQARRDLDGHLMLVLQVARH